MSVAQVARELGVTARCIYKWRKEEGCPWPATASQVRQWAAGMGKSGFASGPGDAVAGADLDGLTRAEWERRYKRSQTLLNESRLQQEKEKFLFEKRDALREEAEAFLSDLIDEIAVIDLPRAAAEKLNGAIERCLKRCLLTD